MVCPPIFYNFYILRLGLSSNKLTKTTVVCCILMQMLCVVHKKASASGGFHPQTPDPLLGLRP